MNEQEHNHQNKEDSNSPQEAIEIPEKKGDTRSDVLFASESFSGPLPPPAILLGYERIQSGLADRIVSMAESQSKHRRDMERKMVTSGVMHERIGMISGGFLTIFAMIVGAVLIYLEKDIAGYISLLGPLGFQGYNYYQVKKYERRDNQKNKQKNGHRED